MKFNIKTSIYTAFVMVLCLAIGSCQKKERPGLGDYPKDSNPPGGPLKFFIAFDGTTPDPVFNAVDSIKANFPSENLLTPIQGISGEGLQGMLDKALKYTSANDFAKSTSFTISLWLKNTPWSGGPEYVMSLTNKDYWHNSAIFMYFEDQTQGSTATTANMKIAVMDQWFEFSGAKLIQKPVFDGAWHHFAIIYDETISKMIYYIDGVELTGLDPSLTDVKNGGSPRGPLKLTDADGNGGSLVVGGWNKQAGLSGPTDSWIQGFDGGMDQVRLYGKALSATEVQALFNSKM